MKTENFNQLERYYYLDWLRVLAILTVFFHHCAKIFDYHALAVFNVVRSPLLSAFREFNFLWMMPLFFIISGASVHFSLKTHTAGGFVKERIFRILIPLLLVGTFIINPLYIYTEKLFLGKAVDGFFQWYPHFFSGFWPAGNFAPAGIGTHLWYLQALFVYSLLLLPLFVQTPKTGKSPLARISVYFEKPWALFLLFLPISAAAAAFEFLGLWYLRITGGWDPVSFLLFFLYGYLLFSNVRILETIRKYATVSLVAAVVLTIFYLDAHFGLHFAIPGFTRHDLHDLQAKLPMDICVSAAVQAFRGLIGWLWILGLTGIGGRLLNFNKPFLSYLNEAVLPFYILHHPVILIIGYFVIQWNGGILVKFVIIAGIALVVIMTIYEFLIRRFNILRFLFGMKPPVGNR